MPPSAPIDSDIDGTTLYVLEAAALWKGTPVGGGAAAWTQVLDAANYSGTMPGLTFGRVRIPAAGGPLYVLGGSETKVYLFRSSSAGTLWQSYEVTGATIAEAKPYTVTTASGSDSTPWQVKQWSVTAPGPIGDDAIKPWGLVVNWNGANCHGPSTGIVDAGGVNAFSGYAGFVVRIGQNQLWANESLDGGQQDVLVGWADDYFGAGNWTYSNSIWQAPMRESGPVGFEFGGADFKTAQMNATVWLFWNEPSLAAPTALDAARTNPNWVYVGTQEGIYKSEDGGSTWVTLLSDDGANDICVDPQLAGAIYTWRAGGSLQLIVDGVVNATLDTETPTATPLRLARDPQSGRLYAIKSGTTLRVRNLATWSDLQTGLSSGRGLHAYTSGKIICVDGADIYASDDYGATIALKKGGWSAYSSGVNGHRLAS